MANIDLLYPGCTGQQIIDTINALIAALNSGQGQTISYNDLADKPVLNGVEVVGTLTTAALQIKFADTSDFNIWENTLATKAYADEIGNNAVEAAENAAQAALDGKLDKDLSNIEFVDTFSGEATIPILTQSGLKKTNLINVATYTVTQSQAINSSYDQSVDKFRKLLPLVGVQNGRNVEFSVTGGYKTGTSCLYLNGQLLASGRDYDETDTQTITFLTYVPEANDVILLKAIPL